MLLADKAQTLIASPNQNNSSRTYKPDLNAFLFATIIAQLLLFMCKKKNPLKKKENEVLFFFDHLRFDRRVIVPEQNAVSHFSG